MEQQKTGGFAEYCSVHYKQVYKISENISFEAGAMAEPVACCLHGIDNCNIEAGSTVLIIGGGTIGLIMLQLAELAGATKIILSEPLAAKREMAIKLGANIVTDPKRDSLKSTLERNHIERISTVIECVGLTRTMKEAIGYAGKNSVVMLFGLGTPSDEITIKPFELFKKEVTIKASYINPYTQGRAVDIIESGKIDVGTLISHSIGLDGLTDILENPEHRTQGKIIVAPWS